MVLLCCLPRFAGAQTAPDADLARGLNWLAGQIQASGELAAESTSPALPVQTRSETLAALHTAGAPIPAALPAAIENIPLESTEHLARQALARQLAAIADTTLLDALAARQNPDGSLGASAGLPGNAQDTAWALRAWALHRAGSAHTTQALSWLLAAQHTEGYWHLLPDGDHVMPTALVVQALAAYRQQPAAAAALGQARAWLLAQRNTSGHWQSDLHTAQTLLAVLPGQHSAASLQTATAALRQAQMADGSWNADPHLSALALQALWLAAQATTDPDAARISGQITDAAGTPIAAATVRLTPSGAQTSSDAGGHFHLDPLTAGAQQLDIQAAGWRPLLAPLHLQAGQRLDLGAIRLSAAASSAVTVRGTARYFDGSNTRAADAATIEIGTQTAAADSNGHYQLDGLPAGTLRIRATYATYCAACPDIVATVTAQTGQIIDFNPTFQQATPASASTLTVVVSGENGQPLDGAWVKLDSAWESTNAQGRAHFATGLVQGTNTIHVEHSGYESAALNFRAESGHNITVPVVLRPHTASASTLKGVVTDAASGQLLADATVRLDGTALRAQTDAQGAYQISDAAIGGDTRVVLEKTGYQPHRQTLALTAGATTVFNVALQQTPGPNPTPGPGTLQVHVEDSTGMPLAGARITLRGANQHSAPSDAQGRATLGPLQTGATQIDISAPGYESALAALTIQDGHQYTLPVQLRPAQAAPQRLHGVVLDATSHMPLPGASVTVAGAHQASGTSASDGTWHFDNVPPGDIQLTITHTGYTDWQHSIHFSASSAMRIALTPAWQAAPVPAREVFGSVLDADTREALAGVHIQLEETDGHAVTRSADAVTSLDGRFVFTGLQQGNARLLLRLAGYDTLALPFTPSSDSQSLGSIALRRSHNAALPDLIISQSERSTLVTDPNTFAATGTITATVTNRSNWPAGGFDVTAFIDTNGNQSWDAGVDTVLGRVRVPALAAQAERTLRFTLADVPLPFRDAPIYLMADSALEVLENIESNNTVRLGASCAAGGGVQDVGVCIDTSPSVSHLYQLEMDGVIQAVENPKLIPHDGSVRFMLGTDYEMYYGSGIPLHPAQIITPATLPQLLHDLKTRHNYGGYSSGPTCVRRMSEYMASLPGQSSKKTVITVGDGYWEGIAAAQAQLPQTVANGVSRVDVIGVGSPNRPELEANAWPQPPNSLHGGQVTVANSAAEVAAAMAQALGSITQTVDLTLGNLRLTEQGAGQNARLAARVGNAGSPAQASAVHFYQGTRLLGQVPVPALQTGQWLDVTLDAAVQGSEAIVAIVDEAGINAECNTANNRQQISPQALNLRAQLHVQTDQPGYPAHTPVALQAQIKHLGQFAAPYTLQLTIEDSQGVEVARFASQSNTLPAAGTHHASEHWNTGTTLAGNYVLRGQLFDAAAHLVAEDSAPFAITATATPAPTPPQTGTAAALRVAPDKNGYGPDDVVLLGHAASNLAANAIIDAARVRVQVSDPQGAIVFTQEQAIGQLPPQGLRQLQIAQPLRGAMQGSYTIAAELLGAAGVPLARASGGYQVMPLAATVADLRGSVSLAQSSLQAGQAQSRSDQIQNIGADDFAALKVIRLLLDAAGSEIARDEDTIVLNAGQTYTWSPLPIDTTALAAGTYRVLLLAEEGGQRITLDQKAFAVMPFASGAGSNLAQVPALSPAALACLVLLLGFMAGAKTRKKPTKNREGT